MISIERLTEIPKSKTIPQEYEVLIRISVPREGQRINQTPDQWKYTDESKESAEE
jgi:hypothetical protein